MPKEPIYLPTETDIKTWVKEAPQEYLQSIHFMDVGNTTREEPLLSRQEIAQQLGISLVILTDWFKRGLSSHKQRGRDYYLYSEVQAYLTHQPLARFRFADRFNQQP